MAAPDQSYQQPEYEVELRGRPTAQDRVVVYEHNGARHLRDERADGSNKTSLTQQTAGDYAPSGRPTAQRSRTPGYGVDSEETYVIKRRRQQPDSADI